MKIIISILFSIVLFANLSAQTISPYFVMGKSNNTAKNKVIVDFYIGSFYYNTNVSNLSNENPFLQVIRIKPDKNIFNAENEIIVTPTLVSTSLSIHFNNNENKNYYIEINNLLGSKMYSNKIEVSENQSHTIYLNNFEQGQYILKVVPFNQKTKAETFKIIKL